MSDTDSTNVFAPRNARTGEPIELAMQKLWLAGRILGVGARLVVRHTFRSGEKKPLEVVYAFGLPRDAALRRFRISGPGFSAASMLKPVDQVRETYEEALAEGRLAAMTGHYGDGLVNLTVGNIRPGEEVTVSLEVLAGVETRDDGLRFRFPFTLAPAYHSRARMAEVAPGAGEIELPGDEFGDLVLPPFVSDASALHEVGFDLAVSVGHPILETSSPSHPIRVLGQGPGKSRVSLATAKDLPDRDLVLDVRTGESLAGVVGGEAADGRRYFAAVVPSTAFEPETAEGASEEARRVVFVLDRSGSMDGAPIKQGRAAVAACLGALGENDLFGLVAFNDGVDLFKPGMVPASAANREEARKFLDGIRARGGTELAAAVRATADLLGSGGPGDVLIVTDGQVMGTEAILRTARDSGLRLHCLGIGSASEDRFLTLLARETGGVSRFLTPRERVDMGAVELFASIGRPLGVGLTAEVEGWTDGRVAPDVPARVLVGRPVVVFGDTGGGGEGRLVLTWESGGGRRTKTVPIVLGEGGRGDGETVRLLQGARLITDLESRYGERAAAGAPREREDERVVKRLLALSRAYGLASREMGLVAVVERAGDRPGDLPVTRVVPVGLAQDVQGASYFGGQKARMRVQPLAMLYCDMAQTEHIFSRFSCPSPAAPSRKSVDEALAGGFDEETSALVQLAARLEPDGGLPGRGEEERVLATVLALLRFLAAGHSAKRGAFRAHIGRMIGFLDHAGFRNDVVEEVAMRARKGLPLAGDWAKALPGPGLWAEIRKAVGEAQGR